MGIAGNVLKLVKIIFKNIILNTKIVTGFSLSSGAGRDARFSPFGVNIVLEVPADAIRQTKNVNVRL